MNEDNPINKFIRWLKARLGFDPQQGGSSQGDEMLVKLLRMLETTEEVELSCGEAFELLDQYVELEARGEDISHLMPLVKKHLDRCRDCHEEYEALVLAYQATS